MRAIPISIRHSLQFEIQVPRLSQLRSLLSPFSSSSSPYADPRVSNSDFEVETEESNSAVYMHKLKFQRPSTVPCRREWWNYASFIGTVAQPLKVFECGAAYTVLSVGKSPQSKGSFRILLNMKGAMASMCLDYLKENDYIHVSGRLRTSVKPQCDGNLRLWYKVIVNEVDYVTRTQDIITSNPQEGQTVEGGSTIFEKHRDRLHLWQVFFYSPYEWWDNRNRKRSSKSPDFRHKDTGECLWLCPDDPPWIKKQLELHDTRLGERGDGEPVGRRARLSHWDYDDDA